MDHTTTGKAGFLKGQFIVVFLFSLIFLVIGSIPTWTNWPGILARFTGVETTARVSVVSDCGDDGGGIFAFTFTDRHEESRHVTNTSTCYSGMFTDGEQVTLWYQPDDPNNFITGPEWLFDSLFLGGFSIPLFVVLIIFVVCLVRRFSDARTAKERTREEYAPKD